MVSSSRDESGRRRLQAAVAVVLAVTFATGGGAQDFGVGDAIAQLLALPVLVLAILAVAARSWPAVQRLAIGVAVAIVLLPALQLVPVPAWLWSMPPGRAALLRDLAAAGVAPDFRWTLAPAATERAFWFEIPALAAFFGAMCVGSRGRRWLCAFVVGLILAGLLLGVVQMGAGQDSRLNPFPEWVPVIRGVFANPNHQASALVIGAVLALALWLDRRRAGRGPDGGRWRGWTLCGCAGVFVLALPATGSRAGMLIAAPAVVGVLWAGGLLKWKAVGASRLFRVAASIAAALAVGSVYLAWRTYQLGMGTEARWPMAVATVRLARDAWPLGVGVGAFRPWFEQGGPDALLLGEFINHAHNEYLQWTLEGGLAAMVLVAAALLALAAVFRALRRREAGPLGYGAWIGVAVLLASSLVEYPMRTAALATIGGFLAGVSVAQASRGSRIRRSDV